MPKRPRGLRRVTEGPNDPRGGLCGVSVVGDHPRARLGLSASRGWRRLDTHLTTLHTVPPFSMAAGIPPYGHGPPFRSERVSGTSSTLSDGRRYCDRRASADRMDFDGPDMDETSGSDGAATAALRAE